MRRYGHWAGNPEGLAEDRLRCVAEIPLKGTYRSHQCPRKRGKGLRGDLCGVHARRERNNLYVRIPEDTDSISKDAP